MAYFRTSIFGRLILYSVWLASCVVILAVTSISTMHVISKQTRALQQVWLVGATQLGKIDYDAEVFRVAELERAMATDPADQRQADRQATVERDKVAQLRQDYLVSRGAEAAATLAPFDSAWNRYMKAHDAWISGSGGAGALARVGGELDMDDQAVNAAIDQIIDEHADRGQWEADSVAWLVQRVSLLAEGVTVAALILLGYVLGRARKDIIWPLAAITRTMTLLASGDREIKVPGHERDDEIGEMAAACEVFRVNVVVLDKAHEAARLAEAQAQLLARHDMLTGLPNRRVFSSDLQEALAHARTGGCCSVLLLDLDDFKRVSTQSWA
ncbi:MAG: MCP four helix bundle domain-containing protein [Acidocella sp.]|nr:MCP four helix bundle domain-containing protein [Acidocella sp.]